MEKEEERIEEEGRREVQTDQCEAKAINTIDSKRRLLETMRMEKEGCVFVELREEGVVRTKKHNCVAIEQSEFRSRKTKDSSAVIDSLESVSPYKCYLFRLF